MKPESPSGRLARALSGFPQSHRSISAFQRLLSEYPNDDGAYNQIAICLDFNTGPGRKVDPDDRNGDATSIHAAASTGSL